METHIKIGKYLLDLLLDGKEVTIGDRDGHKFIISLDEDALPTYTADWQGLDG